uniref:Integrase catalytic domain-containing protein n=1 Tax=Tanacetum cinerariifolium TaxID=118510 RepID=A0A6L2L692_TANCI|nr:hypothetical protein [Tanacetum cinerariifolium]
MLKKEKEGLDSKLTGFQSASKDLDTLLGSHGSDKNKEGLGYSVVPSLLLKPTLLPKRICLRQDYLNLQMTLLLTINGESTSSILSKPEIKFVKAADSPTVIETNKDETVRKPSVKYAEMYRKTSKSSNVRVRTQVRVPRVPTVNRKFPTVNKKFPTGNSKVSTADMRNKGKAVKASACWIWKHKQNSINKDYEPYDGGYVSFGQGGCKITGKGTIKTDESELWHRRLGHLNFKTMNWCDNGGEFRNKEMNDFCSRKGIKREFSNARTPQQNGVAERRNRTLIEAARTMLADAKLPVTFLAKAVNTACYVQNRVLINKSQNKTPYELFNDRTPSIGFLKPFGCHVMILNTLDHLGKFEAKGDEGYFIGYFMSSKAFRVFNKRTKRVEENLHVEFLENKLIEKGAGPNWLFDIDKLTNSMNYVPVVSAGTTSTNFLGTKDAASQDVKKDVSSLRYIALPNWLYEAHLETSTSNAQDAYKADVSKSSGNSNPTATSTNPPADQTETLTVETLIPTFEDILGVSTNSGDTNGVEADIGNLENNISSSPTPTFRIYKDHSTSQIIGPVDTLVQTRTKSKEMEEQSFIASIHHMINLDLLQFCLFSWVRPIGTKRVLKNKKDERGIVIRNKARLVAQGHTQEEGINYKEVFAPVARIEAIRLFLVYASFMGFTVYQMDVKNAFLYGTIDKEAYVMQPPGFQGPEFPARKKDGIFLSQDKYVGDILKKFGYSDVRSANTPMDKENLWGKDRTRKDVDLNLYRSMIGSLMYLTTSRPDIMFAVCACARHQVTPKECHLRAVKMIFRYLKGRHKLGVWYPKDSPFAWWHTQIVTMVVLLKIGINNWRYALTINPTIYVSHIRQFWSTARIETTDERIKILDTIDGKPRTITESFIRRNLKLKDEAGISSLPNAELFENLTLMGYNISPNQKFSFQKGQFSHQWKYLIHTIMQCLSPKSTGFNEFISNIATALICLATNRVYNFSKMIFNGIMQNVNNKVSKFLMYPRFISKCLKMSQFGLITHSHTYTVPFHTRKFFTTLRVNSPSFSGRIVPLFESMLVTMGEGSGPPTGPHHTPSPEAPQSPQNDHSLSIHLPITTKIIPTVIPSDILPLRQYTRRARIAQSLALPTVADEPASPLKDDSQGEACPTISSLEAEQDRANIIKTSTLPHDSPQRVTSLAADEGSMQHKLNELIDLCTRLQRQQTEMAAKIASQDLKIASLKTRIKMLEDKDGGGDEPSGEDATIKGRSLETGEEASIERSTDKGSNDTKEMVNVLTSLDAASILTSGVQVSVPPAAEVVTVSILPAGEIPTVSVPTGSGVVPTASFIFTIATVATPYSKRKGKEKMLEEEMARDAQRMNEQITRDAEIARIHVEEELQILIDGLDRNNETVAKYLQEYEQFTEDLSIGERIELINDLVKYQDNYAKFSIPRRHAGWKTKHFKGMSLEEIREKFIPVWKQIEDFVPMGSKEEGERFKRKGIKLEHKSAKKVKTLEEVSEEDLKTIMQLVPVKKVYVEALQLWALVKETLNIRQATSDKEKELWVELKRLYEPDVEDQLWIQTQALMHDPVEWRLYDTCGVHHVLSRDQEIFMMVEKEYLLRKGLAIVMISNKLQVENYSQMANDLI